MTAETQSVLDLARNIARNSRATQTEKARNKQADSEPDLLRGVAHDRMPDPRQLEAICRRACRDYPDVSPDHLLAFLTEAQDPQWATERVARHLARRMSEGLIRWTPEES